MKLTITALLCPPLLIGGSVAAHTLFDKNIDNGSVPMYAQVTHTGNVVFIDEAEEVFYPCRCRQIKGEPPCCPVDYPSLGFIHERHSPDVVELGNGKGFWCKFTSIPSYKTAMSGKNFPITWCHKSGWVEGVQPKSFSNRSNVGDPSAIILHPAVIDETKLRGFN